MSRDENSIAPIIDLLKASGLYDKGVEQKISDAIAYRTGEPIEVTRVFDGKEVTIEPYLNFSYGHPTLSSYAIWLPDNYKAYHHLEHDGINTVMLEQQLKQLQWVGDSSRIFDNRMTEDDPLDYIISQLGMLYSAGENLMESDYRKASDMQNTSTSLMLKYFTGTPMEGRMGPKWLNWNERYEHSVLFPIHIHINLPGNRINNREELEKLSQLAFQNNPKNQFIMNLNNLENLKEEMKNLGFKDKLIEKMEENMRKDVPEFILHDSTSATKGQVDFALHFKQSNQSDFYYFNKFTVSHNQGKPLEEGQQYMVITKNEEGKNMVKKHENVSDALAFFKEQKGNSELAIGKDAANKVMVASMENGKVNYVAKEFNRTYYASPATQTIWLERGKGFTAEQAANLIQGRSVYRDDMMNMGGETYKAWIKLDFDKGKDRFQNYSINQYHDPSYGFDINKVLDKFNIKELEDPAKKVLLEASLRNGNRPLVTVEKEGQEVKVFLEAVPRYSQLNMYAENGKPEKREQFLKETALSSKQENTKGQEKEISESQGVRR
jgi:hypothetical protein